MPTSYYEKPVMIQAGKPLNFETRSRNWVNTLNYQTYHGSTVSLPENAYDDAQINRYQVLGRETVVNKSTNVTTLNMVGYSSTGALTQRHNDLSNWVAAIEPTDSSLENEALVKALGKIADAKTNLAVSIAEAHKTTDLILSTVNRYSTAYRSFVRGNFKDVARQLNIGKSQLHKSWLEYKYGWMPLLLDVKNSAEFFVQHSFGGKPPRFTVNAVVVAEKQRFQRVLDPTYSPGSWWSEDASSSKRYRVKIACEITNPNFSKMQQLGLTNPALVVWELVPYSFVFDWFCSVGDWLTGLTALHGVTVRSAMSSRVRSVSTAYVSNAMALDTITSYKSGYHFRFTSNGRSYARKSISVDPLSTYPPVNRDPFGFQRLVSGLALARVNSRR